MPLQKSVLDISIQTGLAQKSDPILAEKGISLTAFNLVKNKKDSVQRRLGFTELNRNNNGATFAHSVGLGLGTHLDKLCVFGQGAFGPQSINTISAYSDNESVTTPQHTVPEVLVKPRQYSFSVTDTAIETDVASYGDLLIIVYTEYVGQPINTSVRLSFTVLEASTNNVLIPPHQVDLGTIFSPRVFLCGDAAGGTSIVLTYASGSMAATTIWGLYMLGTNPWTGFMGASPIGSMSNGQTGYDACGISGDPNNFALFYRFNTGSVPTISILRSGFPPSTFATLVSTSNITDSNIGTQNVVGAGIFGDAATGNVAVAYSYIDGSGNTAISTAIATGYPSLAACTASQPWNSGSNIPSPPRSIGICGLGTLADGHPSWGVWWGAPFTNLSGTGAFNNSLSYSYNASALTYYMSIYLTGGGPAMSPALPGSKPRQQFGCLPVSRPTMINGSPYVLVYVPSLIQGSYYLCSADYFYQPSNPNYYPMRIIGNVAPRQCLSDSPIPAPAKYTWSLVPNASLVGCTFTMTHLPPIASLAYSTHAFMVMTTPTLAKQVPTLYEFEANSRHLYESAMHGRSLAFACGSPSVYDGVQAVEISYPYYPEIGAPPVITTGLPNGLVFPNGLGDVYNWIFTYEWYDAQGQRHTSARSPAQQITYDQVFAAGSFPIPGFANVSGTAVTWATYTAIPGTDLIEFSSQPGAYYGITGAATLNQGPVVATGTSPPTVTLTGVPSSSPNSIEIDITTSGPRSSMQFQWRLNGVTQATGVPGAATYVLTGTGMTANFAGATYTNDNVYISTAYGAVTLSSSYTGPASGTITAKAGPTQVNVPFSAEWHIPSLGMGARVMPYGNGIFGPQSMDSGGNLVNIVMYRNEVNGTTYYRVSDPANVGDGSQLSGASSIYNNLSPPYYVKQIDGNVDSVISVHEPLYDDGTSGANGSLDNLLPPSSSILCEYNNRIFIADGNLLWYTKELTPTEAPAFNETSMLLSVGDQSPITALAAMDDKLIIFKRKNIYYLSGQGPADDGSQNDFTTVFIVPTEIGCTDGRSVAVTPEGTYFYSDAGYRILDRSLTIQYAGTAVETELQSNPYVTSVALHPSTNRLVLCANATDVASSYGGKIFGEFLYRDYVLDAWTTGATTAVSEFGRVNNGPFAAGVGLAPSLASPGSFEPTLHLLMADGAVWRENDPLSATAYLDGGSIFFESVLSTSHIKPGDSFDLFARVWSANPLIAVYDTCDVNTTVTTDYGAVTQTNNFTLTTASAPSINVPFTIQTYLQNQRCRAVQVSIVISPPSSGSPTTGQGITIYGITLDVGTYGGADRVPSGNRK